MTYVSSSTNTVTGREPGYRWVILIACTLMIFITYGLFYSYSVFFKPIAEYFQRDRATVSLVYSFAVVIRGAVSIGTGWLADRFGARKILVICGLFIAAGFVLASKVTAFWQFFIAYAVVEAIGMSGIFGIGTALVSRWFNHNRGLAVGIVTSGSGLGTFIIVPTVERLVTAMKWDGAFFTCGIVAGVIMIAGATFLKTPPQVSTSPSSPGLASGATLREALSDLRFYLIMLCFLMFFFGTQIVMIHLVNYATDQGIDSLIAATFISIIGLVSIAGRLSIGFIADRIGVFRSMIITSTFLIASFILLLFSDSLWMFYLSAVMFSIPYGGEVTQIPLIIERYFGTRSMATLVGISLFVTGIGGALGPWTAGKLYDITGSYQWAFVAAIAGGIGSIIVIWLLKNKDRTK